MNLEFLQGLPIFCGRLFFYLYLRLRLLKVWSRIYQAIWERDRTPVKGFSGLGDLVSYVRELKWRPDTWRQLWDATSHPEHVQYLADNDPGKFIGDCDDFAIYEVAVVNNQLRGDALREGSIQRANMLTVPWHGPEGFGGHNVCLIEVKKNCCGPDEETFYCYMDYGWPSAFRDTIDEVAQDVRLRYVGPANKSLGWAVSDSDLNLKKQSWK